MSRREKSSSKDEPVWKTEDLGSVRSRKTTAVRRFDLTVTEGGHLPAGHVWQSSSDRCSIGSHPSNDLSLDEPTVSRFHCEVRVDAEGALVRDLGSRNGTMVDGTYVKEAFLRTGSNLRLGKVGLRFELAAESNKVALSERTEFGSLVGRSVAMRMVFALLERVAASDVTVLLEGETGTGKGAAAESIHRAGARASAPFVVVDCSAIPPNLLESELFGHERGSFTGAAGRRVGAFEEAEGGTVFLDEIGELPAELQPKLLRVLEEREVRRVGSNLHQKVNVRVIAATNRDLRTEVNEKRFRPDLYFRLAVARIALPPLRERAEDIPPLVDRMLTVLGATPELAAPLRSGERLAQLGHASWPGNIRELRNYVERFLVFGETPPSFEPPLATSSGPIVDLSVPLPEARRQLLEDFERRYLARLVERHGARTVQAAAAAGVDRVTLYRLLRRHGLR